MKLRCIKTIYVPCFTLVYQGQIVEAMDFNGMIVFVDTLDNDEWYVSKNEFGQYTFDGFEELGPVFEEAK